VGAIWYRFRAEVRTRGTATLALVLLVGLAGAVVLVAAAGARRTGSAYDRLVEESRASDVLVNPDLGDESALDPEAIAQLPQVESFGYAPAVLVGPAEAESLEELFSGPIAFAGPDGTAFYEIERPNILEGRMPDPSEPDEILIDPPTADRYDLEPGDVLPGAVLRPEDLEQLTTEEDGFARYQRGELGERVDLLVTGVGTRHDAIVVDEGFELLLMVVTPAFYERHPDASAGFWGGMARLKRGAADEPAFRKAVEAMVPDETIEFESTARIGETVDRAVRPYVVALDLFAVAIALTGLLVIGQALARQRFLDAADDAPLQSLGFTRSQVLGVAGLRTGIVALAGAALAVATAVVASRLMPIGPARLAEPDRGVDVDGLALGLGTAATVIAVLALGALPAWRLTRARRALLPAADVRATRPSVVPGALARAGAPATVSTGVRLALEPGRGRTAVPTRTTLVGAAAAVATVAAALTFAASLDHLLATPRLYGVNYDAHVAVSVENEADLAPVTDQVDAVLRDAPDVAAWSRADASRVELDGRAVPAIGLETVVGQVGPTVVSGRIPGAEDEVALGGRTLERFDVDLGDTVTATFGGTTRELRIVGRVVLPATGNYPGGDKTSVGDGAVLTRRALADLAPRFVSGNYLVRFRAGVDPDAGRVQLARQFADSVDVEVAGIAQPADVVDYERVRATPLVLAALFAILGVATVTHAMVATVRRRGRDLALLKTLGFTRPQVSATVAWQATTVAVIALVVGLPVGIATGRLAWTLLAESIGAVAEPATPLLVVVLAVPVALLVTNLVAAAPAWLAGRTSPAAVLRAE
jgi:hypothetical protein